MITLIFKSIDSCSTKKDEIHIRKRYPMIDILYELIKQSTSKGIMVIFYRINIHEIFNILIFAQNKILELKFHNKNQEIKITFKDYKYKPNFVLKWQSWKSINKITFQNSKIKPQTLYYNDPNFIEKFQDIFKIENQIETNIKLFAYLIIKFISNIRSILLYLNIY